MDSKKILEQADKALDPLGVILIVLVYFLNKYTVLDLTVDEVLLISIGAGAFRSVWEGYKRKQGINVKIKKVEAGNAQEVQMAEGANDPKPS